MDTKRKDGMIDFAERLLWLLDQGSFATTYKYAVLLALLDLCLEHTQQDGSAPELITTRELAERVLEIYWPQTADFREMTLRQYISGPQAQIINDIVEFRRTLPDTTFSPHRAGLVNPDDYKKLLKSIEWTLISMPLPRLQVIGSQPQQILYQIGWGMGIKKGELKQYFADGGGPFDNRILLLPDVGEWLVRLGGLLRPIIHRSWAAMVAKINKLDEDRLEKFLFGIGRTSLLKIRRGLVDIQKGCCFYCKQPISNQSEVDHFVPWARYPDNSFTNLVLADRKCNHAKRDFLAAVGHLERWMERNEVKKSTLAQMASDLHWEYRPEETLGVARGLYLRLPAASPLWRNSDDFEPADPDRIVTLFRNRDRSLPRERTTSDDRGRAADGGGPRSPDLKTHRFQDGKPIR